MTKIIFKDSRELEIPRISTYRGWVYRPAEARTQAELDKDKNKSFGRANPREADTVNGADMARAWQRGHLQRMLDTLDWPEIAMLDGTSLEPWNDSNLEINGLNVGFKHPNFGWQRLQMYVQRQSTRHTADMPVTLKLIWTGNSIQKWYEDHKVPDDLDYAHPLADEVLATWREEVSITKAYELAARFANRPLSFAKNTFDSLHNQNNRNIPIDNDEEVPLDWASATPKARRYGHTYEQSETLHIRQDTDHHYWRNRKHIHKVVIESTSALENLAQAWDHLDIQASFRTRQEYSPDSEDYGKSYLEKARFVFPGTPDDNNRLGHEIVISEHDVTVVCGYVKDDKLWTAQQVRNAATWLDEIKAEPTIDEYEEYEYTPNV